MKMPGGAFDARVTRDNPVAFREGNFRVDEGEEPQVEDGLAFRIEHRCVVTGAPSGACIPFCGPTELGLRVDRDFDAVEYLACLKGRHDEG